MQRCGAGNGNGNGNNNAVITIQNDPTFLTCPPCEQRLPLPDTLLLNRLPPLAWLLTLNRLPASSTLHSCQPLNANTSEVLPRVDVGALASAPATGANSSSTGSNVQAASQGLPLQQAALALQVVMWTADMLWGCLAGQYYDPSQQLCITVQTCVANKPTPSPSPAGTSGAAGTAPATVADAAPASGASGVVTSTAGRRRLLLPWGQRLASFW